MRLRPRPRWGTTVGRLPSAAASVVEKVQVYLHEQLSSVVSPCPQSEPQTPWNLSESHSERFWGCRQMISTWKPACSVSQTETLQMLSSKSQLVLFLKKKKIYFGLVWVLNWYLRHGSTVLIGKSVLGLQTLKCFSRKQWVLRTEESHPLIPSPLVTGLFSNGKQGHILLQRLPTLGAGYLTTQIAVGYLQFSHC